MTTSSPTPSSAGKIDAFAINRGITPERFRTLLVQEFSRDIATQIGEFVEHAELLESNIARVTPKRANEFGITLLACYESLLDMQKYLESLRQDPLAWPDRQ